MASACRGRGDGLVELGDVGSGLVASGAGGAGRGVAAGAPLVAVSVAWTSAGDRANAAARAKVATIASASGTGHGRMVGTRLEVTRVMRDDGAIVADWLGLVKAALTGALLSLWRSGIGATGALDRR